tara:strand:+ start:3682 stop:4788 length:1107 start_codon:yes stop_codon:yes gene_type:complete
MSWILATDQITRLQLEVTNYCNAGCPQCARVNYLSKKFTEAETVYPRRINSNHFDLDKYKQILHNDTWGSLKYIHFCGNYDEPTIHPQFIDMLEHTMAWLQQNKIKDLSVNVSTNGGARDSEFWQKIGELSKKYQNIGCKLTVIWGIDGLQDTNHIYRIGVAWNKLMNNVQAYHKMGGISCWQWIRFQHNEHQLSWAQQNYKQLGFESFYIIGTDRDVAQKKNELLQQQEKIPSFSRKKIEAHIKNDIINTTVAHTDQKNQSFSQIHCKALDHHSTIKRSIYIDAQGHVMPCCWMGTDYSKHQAEQSFLGDATPDSHNIYQYDSVGECLKSPYFTQLIDSWQDKSYSICATYCTAHKDPYTQSREFLQ